MDLLQRVMCWKASNDLYKCQTEITCKEARDDFYRYCPSGSVSMLPNPNISALQSIQRCSNVQINKVQHLVP